MNISKLKVKPYSNIKNLSFSYIDDSFSFKGDNILTSDNFNYTTYNSFDNFNDLSINNYSYFFLGNRKLVSDWLKLNTKDNSLNAAITPLVFFINDVKYYLKFDTNNLSRVIDHPKIWNTGAELTNVLVSNNENFIFNIEYIDNITCYVKFISSSETFYLYNRHCDKNGNGGLGLSVDDLYFTSDKTLADKWGQFRFINKDNYFQITSYLSDYVKVRIGNKSYWVNKTENISNNKIIASVTDPITYYVEPSIINSTIDAIEDIGYVRSIYPEGNTIGLIENKNLDTIIGNHSTLIETNIPVNSSFNFLNGSWISYEDKNSLNISKSKSDFDLENQYLFHLQYNKIDNEYKSTLNFIPLKNQVSNHSNIIRGNNLITNDTSSSDSFFREYTSLETGSNQELGNANITLMYTYYDSEFEIAEGESLHFTINSDDSLYPFLRLNINDSKFIKNGALGSSIPFLADKVQKKLNTSDNNARYLYTWLFQDELNPYGMWLDRYYYPDLVTKYEVLKSKVHFKDASFNNILDLNYNTDDDFLSNIEDKAYFDKLSDLTFEGGNQYVYERIGNDKVLSILNDISENKTSELSEYKEPTTLDINKNKESGMLDLYFDMYLAPNKTYGYEIMSMAPNAGISVKNTTNYTPYSYTFNGNILKMYNNDFNLLKSIDLSILYNTTEVINKIIIDLPFEDIAIFTDNSMIILSYDLMVKEKIELTTFLPVGQVKDIKLHNNKVYFLSDKIFVYSLETKVLSELKRFNTTSILANKNGKIYPIYSSQISFERESLGIKYYKVFNTTIDSLPYGLVQNDIVTIDENIEYSVNYWYYAPIIQNNVYEKLIIDKNSDLFALPYSEIAVLSSSVVGVRVKEENKLYQIENVNLEEYKVSQYDNEKNILFTSYNKIYSITSDLNDNLAILKDEANKIGTAQKIQLLIFDKTKKQIGNYVLGNSYLNLFGLDSENIFNNGSYFILFGTKLDNVTNELKYYRLKFKNNELISSNEIEPTSLNQYKTINFNNVAATYKNNKLDFILSLPKESLLVEQYVYSLDMENIIQGWYNINIKVNLNEGIFETYVNDKLLPTNNQIEIDKYIYNLKNVFNYPLIVGTASYRNGILLSEFLNSDSYNAKDLRIKNLIIYDKILNHYEKQATLISKNKINKLVITLPCGQKNNLEEIIRYFKYNPPANISNTIKIIIQNSNISDKNEQQNLAIDILNKITTELSCPLTIQEISFT